MSDNQSRLARFVSELNRRTQDGELQWRVEKAPEVLTCQADRAVVSTFLTTTIGGKRLAVYEMRVKRWTDEDQWHWDSQVCFGVFTTAGALVTELIGLPGLQELLRSAGWAAAGMDELVNEVLGA